MYDLTLRCAHLVTPTKSAWFEKESQVIAIQDGAIKKIAPATQSWKTKFKAKKYLDLSNHLVLPGLVNAHTHLPMTLFRGLAEDMEFHQWLNDYILPVEKEILDPAFVRAGAELAAWECIQQGVTCVNDMYYFTDTILDVLDKAGLRGFVCQTFMTYPTPDNKNQDQSDEKILEKCVKKFKNHPRLRPAVGPHAPYTCSDEVLKRSRELADQYQIPLHIHVSETLHEVEESKKQFGKSPVQRLYDLGVMKGPVSFAHAIHLSDQDIQLIKKSHCGLVHNPESNMKITAGVCQVSRLLKEGVTLGLGTDGAASNNNLNMIQEMDTGIKLQKLQGNGSVTSRDFLRMATLGSAECLGLDHLVGSLEEGKRADLIALSLEDAHMLPLHDAIAQVVYSASGGEVTHTICEGRILMQDRKIRSLDIPKIRKTIEKYQKKIKKFLAKRA